MDESTSMLIDVDDLTDGKKELLIVLIGAEDEVCNFVNTDARRKRCEGRKEVGESLQKTVTITLEPTARTDDRLKATFIVAIGYLGITIACFIVSGYLFKFDMQDRDIERRKPVLEDEMRAAGEEKTLGDLKIEDGQTRLEEAVSIADEEGEEKTKIEIKDPGIENGEVTLLDPQTEEGLQTLCSAVQRTGLSVRKPLYRRTLPLTAPNKSKSRYKKNQLFMGGLFIISIFYAVTVLQTAFAAQRMSYETGNNDICYFNSRCQIPLLYTIQFVLDFNHVFSNLGYVVFGFTFIGIVYMKSKRYADNVNELLSNHGVPYLTGVYYSMGGALVMEGLMSAAYHICPTTTSFQFDTTFMYLIAILIHVNRLAQLVALYATSLQMSSLKHICFNFCDKKRACCNFWDKQRVCCDFCD